MTTSLRDIARGSALSNRAKKKEDLLARRRKDAKSVLPFLASSRLSAINPSFSFRAFVASCEKNYLTQSHKDTKEVAKEAAHG